MKVKTRGLLFSVVAIVLLGMSNSGRAGFVTYSVQTDGTISHVFGEQRAHGSWAQDWLATSGDYSSYGGSAMPLFTDDMSQNNILTISFSAPAGMAFYIQPTDWDFNFLKLYFFPDPSTSAPYKSDQPATFDWVGLSGTAPKMNDRNADYTFGMGNQGMWLQLQTDNITAPFSFTGFQYTIIVPDGFNPNYSGVTLTAALWAEADTFLNASDPGAMVSLVSVPEPSTYALFGMGAIGILIVLRRKKTA